MDQEKFDSGISGASNFRANRLVFSPEKVAVRRTIWHDIFFGFFVFLALIAILPIWSPGVPVDVSDKLIFTAAAALFAVIGLFGIFWRKNTLPEIDLINGRFYPVSPKIAKQKLKDDTAAHGIPLTELDTVEAASHISTGSKSSYTNYRLILTFRNGHRSCLLSHGSLEHFIADAEKLAQVLNRPLTGIEEIKADQGQEIRVVAGCGMTIFSIFWLCVSCGIASSFFNSQTWQKMNVEFLCQHPEHLLIFMPILFILFGLGLLISGIRQFVRAIINVLKKEYPGLR